MKKGILLILAMLCADLSHAQSLKSFGIEPGILGTNFVAPTIAGKLNVYDPMTGEIIYDSSDATFYGRNHSSTWVPLGGPSNVIPTGTILTFAASVCPTGYLATDGSAFSRTTYASLFAVIGTTHGQGDGATTFNVPDYRGRFLRGVDGAAGRDPNSSTRTAMGTGGNTGNNVGSVQVDAIQGHAHIAGIQGSYGSYAAITSSNATGGDSGVNQYRINSNIITSDGTNGTPRTSSETRPTNAYVNYCIKY